MLRDASSPLFQERLRLAGRFRALARLVLVTAVVLALAAATLGPARPAAAETCQTEFIVFTDPTNPGARTDQGQTTIVRDSGVLGSYLDGRLAGYGISGQQDLIINNVTQQAQIVGVFTATSPDGGSSLTVRYAGHADLSTGQATGRFVVLDGTGEFAGYHARGRIDAQLVGPATFQGFDIGLC
jgi:hypothetical protein